MAIPVGERVAIKSKNGYDFGVIKGYYKGKIKIKMVMRHRVVVNDSNVGPCVTDYQYIPIWDRTVSPQRLFASYCVSAYDSDKSYIFSEHWG
jgi:hypothetical protein